MSIRRFISVALLSECCLGEMIVVILRQKELEEKKEKSAPAIKTRWDVACGNPSGPRKVAGC